MMCRAPGSVKTHLIRSSNMNHVEVSSSEETTFWQATGFTICMASPLLTSNLSFRQDRVTCEPAGLPRRHIGSLAGAGDALSAAADRVGVRARPDGLRMANVAL